MRVIKYKLGKKTITNKIAYIAGFVDGEGCIRIKRANQGGNSYYITLQITNSNYGILSYIQDLFGGQIGFQEKGTNKKLYQYRVTASEAVELLKVMRPFLIDKRSQALLAIFFHEHKENLLPESKERVYRQMMDLKKRNNNYIYENGDLLK